MIGKQEKEEYHHPVGSTNRDELAGQLPVNHTEHKPNQHGTHAACSQSFPDSLREGGCDLPKQYQNLDEVKEPGPIESSDIPRPRGYLEDHLSNTAQPENRRKGEASSTWLNNPNSAERPSPAPRQRVTRLATEFYTISYLILFSILGTLARLGLQALTFYPGAPVATGVLWANVAGSFIMGFLAQDPRLCGGRNDAPTPPRLLHHRPNLNVIRTELPRSKRHRKVILPPKRLSHSTLASPPAFAAP